MPLSAAVCRTEPGYHMHVALSPLGLLWLYAICSCISSTHPGSWVTHWLSLPMNKGGVSRAQQRALSWDGGAVAVDNKSLSLPR